MRRSSANCTRETRGQLWAEYKLAHLDGYQYTQFCAHYHRWCRKLDLVLRQPLRAGHKKFLDFAGQTVPVGDPVTGQVQQAHIFVAVLAASNYANAEATWSEDLWNWIGANCCALDKVKAEAAVLIVERWILAALRNRRFFSLTELNEAIAELP